MGVPPNNTFSGPQSVADFLDPDKNPLLPLVEIPDRLNPFREEGVRIYAKMLTCLPAQNVKSLPALKMLRNKPDAHNKKIVEASSGSTVLSLGIVARVLWGNEDVDAYVTNKKPPESLNMLRFFGIRPCLYGGLAQQEPTDPTGIMSRLRRKAAENEHVVYPGQYDNPNNWKAHEQWTGPQIYEQLPQINVFCSTVGTGGAITGTGVYLKSQKPDVKVIGVFNHFGDPTPGPRHFHGFHTSGFPWQDAVDSAVEVASVDAYRMSMRLSREGLIAGPSSGEALHGLLEYVAQRKKRGELDGLRDPATGHVSCVFPVCDLPYQYLPAYYQKLGKDEFPPIQNEILLHCDQTKYDERWVLTPQQAATLILGDLDASDDSLHKKSLSSLHSARPGAGELVAVQALRDRRYRIILRLLRRSQADDTPHNKKKKKKTKQQPQQQQPLAGWTTRRARRRGGARAAVEAAEAEADGGDAAVLVLDLRRAGDFAARHVAGAHSVPLAGLTPALAGGDLYGDADAVGRIWGQVQDALDAARVARLLRRARATRQAVVTLCYDGHASQLATSTLRDRGCEAFSVLGGLDGLWPQLEGLRVGA